MRNRDHDGDWVGATTPVPEVPDPPPLEDPPPDCSWLIGAFAAVVAAAILVAALLDCSSPPCVDTAIRPGERCPHAQHRLQLNQCAAICACQEPR